MGRVYACLAAICNATIGIFSKLSFGANVDHVSLAFFRCFIAFCVLSIILIVKDELKEIKDIRKHLKFIGLTSFFGVFILYYFEIWALTLSNIGSVSFLIYASSTLTVIFGVFWLGESLNKRKIISVGLTLLGMYFMLSELIFEQLNLKGGLLAIMAGIGYSLFLVLAKKFKLPGNLAVLWCFFGIGSIYLFIPFFFHGAIVPDGAAYSYVFALALIPTIGGFYFTSKALTLIEAGKVQILEMSEPVFASVFAAFFFYELLRPVEYLGAFFIVLGVFTLEQIQFGSFFTRFIFKFRKKRDQ